MDNEFKDIVILRSKPDFTRRVAKLRLAIMNAARFKTDDIRRIQLSSIVQDVMRRGDKAVAEFTEKFDGVKLSPDEFLVSRQELTQAYNEIDPALLKALRQSIENVEKYQSEIFIGNKNTHPGIKYTPIKRVGICIPGASAPLPSTVIMTAVPAIVAGVREIAVVSPPRYNGTIHPVIMAVCHELGIKEVYRIGGAQAVAALARGSKPTDTTPNVIRKVDKIVGPGNVWVQMAKREVFGLVDIDSIAGPSEVLIIANNTASPAWVAADMLSQAEHDPGSAVVFTDSRQFAEKVLEKLAQQVKRLNRAEAAAKCLKKYSGIVVFNDMGELIQWANDFAAEHLQIQCNDKSREIAGRINDAGAIFIGEYSPVALGDYWAGPSHTLPTGMSAKFFSALSSNDFIKSTSIIEYDRQQLTACSEDIIRIAMVEGLDAHARSIRIRRQGFE